jgi:hypothetical protein
MFHHRFNLSIVNTALLTCLIISCKSTRVIENRDNEVENSSESRYTLNPVPNQLDTVGVIFGIDKKGVPTVVPGSPALTVIPGNITTPVVVKTRKTSLSLAGKFLKLKSADSLASTKFYDTLRTTISFNTPNGILSRTPDDIAEAFEKSKQRVINNIKFLGMEKQTFYMVLETVKTDSLVITVDASGGLGGKVSATIKKMIDLGIDGNTQTTYSNNLIYHKTNQPVVVFYTLRKINLNITGSRGTPDYKVTAELGDEVTSSILPVK